MDKKYSIQEYCQDILIKRFPGDKLRQKINDTNPIKLNFACPFCGDSHNDPKKKRGNLHLDTQTYKCYNDGCMIWLPLSDFISRLTPKYKVDIPDIQESTIKFDISKSRHKRGFIIEFLLNNEANKKLLSFSDIVWKFSLTPCKDADPKSRVGTYVRNRHLIGLPMFEKTCYFDSSQNKIFLFNLDLKSDRLIGFSMRKIDDSAPGLRYNIKDYKDFQKTGLAKGLSEEYINEIIQINNYYNVLNLDFSEDITVTEGQIDAMFIRNCVATTGVSKSRNILESLTTKNKTRVLFDNDGAGLKASIDLLRKGYRVFQWANVIDYLKKTYPKDIYTIRKHIKDINDLYSFIKLRDTSLNYEKFNDFIDHYFSDSIFDLLSL